MKPVHRSWRGNIPKKNISFFATLEMYNEMPIDVTQKRLGASGPGGTYSEAQHGCILKLGDYSKRLHTIMETIVDCLSNGNSPQMAYCEFMSGRLIALDKKPNVRLVNVRETLRRIFAKIVRKFIGP